MATEMLEECDFPHVSLIPWAGTRAIAHARTLDIRRRPMLAENLHMTTAQDEESGFAIVGAGDESAWAGDLLDARVYADKEGCHHV